MEVKYLDFSLIVPDDWRQITIAPFIKTQGGKIAFVSPYGSKWGTFNVAVVTSGFKTDLESRKHLAKLFMGFAAFFTLKWRAKIYDTGRLLDGEANTAWVEMKHSRGKRGKVLLKL